MLTYGGSGKTFVWKTLSAAIRSKGVIVLNIASSGIGSLLLPGGRTAHSRFVIPLNLNEISTCNIKQPSELAELIEKIDLTIWDEAPMMSRFCFEALDRSSRDIMRNKRPEAYNEPFGGFCAWKKNMRLQNCSNDDVDDLRSFSSWLIGDGTLGGDNDGEIDIYIPDDLLITESDDFVRSIVDATYPEFCDHIGDLSYLQGRAILAPTLEEADLINEYIVSMYNTDERVYLSSDYIATTDRGISTFEQMHSVEYLNSIKCSGVPNHQLKLKVGVPVILLRNIDLTVDLCNGKRLVVTKLGSYVIEARVLGGNNAGDIVYIPRMTLRF
ncbi:hypothetical protein OROMI_009350 [Orobanche minor]